MTGQEQGLMLMRLFVALTPPPEVAEELRVAVAPLRQLAPGLRWTRPEQWHLTLVFLGEVSEARVGELSGRLGRAAGRYPPMTLSFGGGGRFGQRVLWTRVHGDRDPLRRLAESVRAAARRTGLAVDSRAYRPHLTLARGSGSDDLRPLAEQLTGFAGRPWVASRLDLIQSRLGAGPGGSAQHEPVAGWPLGG